jgi:hypothetical protein
VPKIESKSAEDENNTRDATGTAMRESVGSEPQ